MSRFTTRHFLLISLFFTSVSGAYLQYGSIRLFPFASPRNVTLTVGKSETVFCLQLTGPVPSTIQWYNPQGQLVSRTSRDDVHQFVVGGGKVAYLKFKSYNHSHGGKYECRVAVPGKNVEKRPVHIGDIVPATDTYPSPVHWDQICDLKPSKYIDYGGLIANERTPALFPQRDPCSSSGILVKIGHLYVHTASGVYITTGPRRVYFEASDPQKPIMRVPKLQDDEGKVVTSYPWDSTNFVYKIRVPPRRGKYVFQMFTPANLHTYGITTGLDAHNGVAMFAMLREGDRVQDFFTYFQIRKGQEQAPITSAFRTDPIGLYVDVNDGWKVKVTTNTSLWDEFQISRSNLSPNIELCE